MKWMGTVQVQKEVPEERVTWSMAWTSISGKNSKSRKVSKEQMAVRHFLNKKIKVKQSTAICELEKFPNTFSLHYQLERRERERLVGKGNERQYVWYQNWMERDYTGCNYSLTLSSNVKPSLKLLGGDGLPQLQLWLSLKRGKFFL